MNTNSLKKYFPTEIGGKLTKDAIWAYPAYKRSTKTDLYKAYKRFSQKKAAAWKDCEEMCHNLKGWDLKIISANTYQFSAGFKFSHPDTGEVCFMYITASANRWYPVMDEYCEL